MVADNYAPVLRLSLLLLAVVTLPGCTKFSGVIWEIDGDVITRCTGTVAEAALRERGTSVAPLPGVSRGWELRGARYDGVTIETRRGKTLVSLSAPESRPQRTANELAASVMPAHELAQTQRKLCDGQNSLALKCIRFRNTPVPPQRMSSQL